VLSVLRDGTSCSFRRQVAFWWGSTQLFEILRNPTIIIPVAIVLSAVAVLSRALLGAKAMELMVLPLVFLKRSHKALEIRLLALRFYRAKKTKSKQ
jgi:hypothetical protein